MSGASRRLKLNEFMDEYVRDYKAFMEEFAATLDSTTDELLLRDTSLLIWLDTDVEKSREHKQDYWVVSQSSSFDGSRAGLGCPRASSTRN